MRVLIIVRNLTRSLSAPHYSLKLAQSLVLHGCETFLLTSNIQVALKGVQVITVPKLLATRKLSPIAYSLIAKYMKKRHDIDIVHGHGYTLMDDVTTVHFLRKAFKSHAEKLGYRVHFQYDTLFESLILKSSRHLIAPSNLCKRGLMDFYEIKENRISVVHTGVDINEFSPPSPKEEREARQKMGIEADHFYIGFTGPPYWKGLHYLIQAVARLQKDIHLAAVNSYDHSYVRLASRLGIDERVILLPPYNDMSTFYKAVDIFALPSIYDTFSLSVLEAMASGLPVIVSSSVGASEIIEDGKNGFIIDSPNNVRRLAEVIETLASNEKTRKRIGINARRTAENLSWYNVAHNIIEVYESLLKH